ncbi:portal protein [Erwinia phage Pavtok]|uniref:Portal protein n=1 Tax=Erwinia phage Pavtok TaxID=2267655 RepID=A0A345BLW4_9CAUD|nr:portal protein [Erwinia phage Pavtok]AXF51435.1 hypothetical protein PAVTOK_7 [Erwinia phage Pavtok]
MFDDDIKNSGMDFANGRVDSSDPYSRMPEQDADAPKKRHKLDSPPMEAAHRRLIRLYEDELDRQSENRSQMARDEDFYDNDQWREEDARALRERGQVPLVYNVISSSINWVLGTEKRGRTDYKILPRRKDASKPAERKTQLMKYLSDVNMTPFHRSRAFEDSVKVGIGWIETGVQNEDDGEPVFTRYESWRNLLWDSACTENDLKDCRYIFRAKWVDLDIAEAMFPDRIGTLRAAAAGNQAYGLDEQGDDAMDSMENQLSGYASIRSFNDGFQRGRVRLIECWYRKPTKAKRMVGGDFTGELFDEQNPSPGHQQSIDEGEAVPMDRTMMQMHVAIMCNVGMLYHAPSPYRHNQFPFTPLWCYRRGRDNLPYGMIRGMRDMQEDINKRASKALHILSTNKVIMDEGAVDDLDEFAEEVSRPDAILVKKKGYQLEINAERELAPAHLDLMSRSISMIQTLSGVTDENMGRATNATSGRAINARQEQGSMTTAGIFDNLRFAVQIHGQKELSLIEQFFTERKQFRITNARGTPEYIEVNDGLPENDIVRSKADFIISDADWRASVRQAQTEELFALLQQLAPVAPQVALVMLDLIVEGMDVTSRDEIVKRIRQVTGMRDPDAEDMTPEEKEAEAAKQQAEAAQAELNQRAVMAKIAVDEARAQKDMASIGKTQADVKKVLGSLAGENVSTQLAALQAAIAAIQTPGAVGVADGILHESGFVSRTEEDAATQAAVEEAQQQQQEQAAQQQAQQEQQQAEQQQAGQQEQQPEQAQGAGLNQFQQ